MNEKQKQTAGQDTARLRAAEGHLRQALVGMAKAKGATRRHAEASGSTEGRGTASGHSAPSGQ